MQKCKGCGKEIKYIATTKGVCVVCDAAEMTIYTMNGRKVDGYKIHVCEKENEDESDEK